MTTTQSPQETLPPELYADLASYDPRSHEYQEGLKVANELARECGYRLLTSEDIFPPTQLEVPSGFKNNLLLKNGLTIPRADIEGKVHSLANNQPEIVMDVQRMVTDRGASILVGDLRGSMTSQTQKLGPENAAETSKLDRTFYTDVKNFAEQNGGLYSVRAVPGVYYSKPSKTMLRAYWIDLGGDSDGTRRIARIADARTKAEEESVYSKVLKTPF